MMEGLCLKGRPNKLMHNEFLAERSDITLCPDSRPVGIWYVFCQLLMKF
jgi:hypothetical protein